MKMLSNLHECLNSPRSLTIDKENHRYDRLCRKKKPKRKVFFDMQLFQRQGVYVKLLILGTHIDNGPCLKFKCSLTIITKVIKGGASLTPTESYDQFKS